MKKTTIALLTAAAMGTSGAAMAATHGPEFSGRVNVDVQNKSGENTAFTTGNFDRLEINGGGDLVGGLTGTYFVRFQAGDLDDSDDDDVDTSQNISTTLVNYTISGDFGAVTVGRDDDLVYKFVGARTDIPYANLGGVPASFSSSDYTVGSDNSLQYQLSVDALTFGAYVDTGAVATGIDDGDFEFGDASGFNNYQLGVTYDFGMGSAGLVYSDSDEATVGESELAFGVSATVADVSLAGVYYDDAQGNNPFSLFAGMPLQGGLFAYAAYGDNDVGRDDFLVGVSADLGGGFVTYVEYQDDLDGDGQNGVVLGSQFNF